MFIQQSILGDMTFLAWLRFDTFDGAWQLFFFFSNSDFSFTVLYGSGLYLQNSFGSCIYLTSFFDFFLLAVPSCFSGSAFTSGAAPEATDIYLRAVIMTEEKSFLWLLYDVHRIVRLLVVTPSNNSLKRSSIIMLSSTSHSEQIVATTTTELPLIPVCLQQWACFDRNDCTWQ